MCTSQTGKGWLSTLFYPALLRFSVVKSLLIEGLKVDNKGAAIARATTVQDLFFLYTFTLQVNLIKVAPTHFKICCGLCTVKARNANRDIYNKEVCQALVTKPSLRKPCPWITYPGKSMLVSFFVSVPLRPKFTKQHQFRSRLLTFLKMITCNRPYHCMESLSIEV